MNIQSLTLMQSQLLSAYNNANIWYTVWKNCHAVEDFEHNRYHHMYVAYIDMYDEMTCNDKKKIMEGYRKTVIEVNRVKDYERMQANCKGTDGRRDSEQMRILWYCT